MFTKSIFKQPTNNSIDGNDLTLKCGYLNKNSHRRYNQPKEINTLTNATNVLITGHREDIILDLIKGSMYTFTDQEVKSFNLYDELLLTYCTVQLKKTNAGNIMFNIIEPDGQCIGIYGDLDSEERAPCVKSNNLPSLTCFKDFAEHGDYVGIVERALHYDTLQIHGGFDAPYNLGLVIKLNSLDETTREYFKNKYGEDFICLEVNGEVIFNIVSAGFIPFDKMIKDISNYLNISLDNLYDIRLRTDQFIEEQAKIDKREKPYTGIDRLYRAYDMNENCIVYY